jgi:hypothetical protein
VKNFSKNFEKPLDKSRKVCYNIYRKKEMRYKTMTIFNKIFNRRKQTIEIVKDIKFKVVGVSQAGTHITMFVTAKNEAEARRIAMGTNGTDSRAYTTRQEGNWTTRFKGIYYVVRA